MKTFGLVLLALVSINVHAKDMKVPKNGLPDQARPNAKRCYCDILSSTNGGCSADNETDCTKDTGCKWTCVYESNGIGNSSGTN